MAVTKSLLATEDGCIFKCVDWKTLQRPQLSEKEITANSNTDCSLDALHKWAQFKGVARFKTALRSFKNIIIYSLKSLYRLCKADSSVTSENRIVKSLMRMKTSILAPHLKLWVKCTRGPFIFKHTRWANRHALTSWWMVNWGSQPSVSR